MPRVLLSCAYMCSRSRQISGRVGSAGDVGTRFSRDVDGGENAGAVPGAVESGRFSQADAAATQAGR